jgi:hypothetical protein
VEENVPKVFANKLLRQLVDHLTGGGLVIEPKDYVTLRLAFRQRGGEWEAIVSGSPKHLGLLKDIVTAWVKIPGRPTTEEEFV